MTRVDLATVPINVGDLPDTVVSDVSSTNASGDYAVIKEAPLNPLWAAYGAKFDGSTDDATAIQSTLNALSSGGQMLWPGDAIVGSSLTFPFAASGKIKVIGLGIGKSRVRQKSGTTIAGVFSIGDGRNNVEISDLEMDQSLVTGGTTSQQMAIYALTASNGITGLRLRRLYIHGGPQYGIRYQNNGVVGTALELEQEDVRVESFAGIGIYSNGFNSISVPSITKARIFGGWVKGCTSDGLQFNNASNVELHGFNATDQTGGHGVLFSGTNQALFTYNSSTVTNPNQLTNVTISTGALAVGQTLAGGLGAAQLGVIPTGTTITAVTGTGPYTVTMSANALQTVTGYSAVAGFFSHNLRVFGGEFSRNDPTGTGTPQPKIGLIFSVGSYDFQAIGPRCDANGGLGLSVDTADASFDEIVYDVGGLLVAPICSNTVVNHGIYYNWAADGLTIVSPRCYGNTGSGIGLVGSRARIVSPHLVNNGGYGYFSEDAVGHTGAPPCGGHRILDADIWGNATGRMVDSASIPTTENITPWAGPAGGGEYVLPPAACDSVAVTMTTAQMPLTYFTAQTTEPITKIRLLGGTTAAGATPSLVQAAIYSVTPSTGALTAELAHTANVTGIFATANTEYEETLSSTFNKVAGTMYAVGVLVISSQTMPTLVGKLGLQSAQTAGGNNRPRITAVVTGLAALPSSFPQSVNNQRPTPQFLLEP